MVQGGKTSVSNRARHTKFRRVTVIPYTTVIVIYTTNSLLLFFKVRGVQ